MEQQLEILCRDTGTPIQNESNAINHNTLQALFLKIKELIKSDKHVAESWEIPIEKITVKELQGFGSQGDVFYGNVNQKAVAIKRVKDKSLTERAYLGNLDHKNLIKFKGVNHKFNYIIMEWCPYGNLKNLIHSGRQIPAEILADFGNQIANGMCYLHTKKNIIHCDLKPSNILITHNNVLKISDFESHQLGSEPCRNNIGTVAYMAPELIRGEPYSFPIDVWSYGVVLWEILTGHEPYENSPSSAVVYKIGHNSKLHIPSDSFPSGYRQILDGCWQSEPKARLNFPQICLKYSSAMAEIYNITKDRWIPLQAQWNKSIRRNRDKFDCDGDDENALKLRLARLEKKLARDHKRNNDLYLKLQETSMLLERDKKKLATEKLEMTRREEEVSKREAAVTKREQELANLPGANIKT